MTIGQVVERDMPHPHLTIKRIPCGKGVYYRYTSGRKVEGQRVLRRIKSLAIPLTGKVSLLVATLRQVFKLLA